ncbi:MAG: hypothetical protein DYG89_13715 [Caldilinea sp. CFX5]|nr:hypothetical protein [Caldilinea sp. CFX5]
MRKFSSYGPIDPTIHYHASRTILIDCICARLLGEDPSQGGHYITIWSPLQAGESWVTNQVLYRLQKAQPTFDVVKLTIQDLNRSSMVETLRSIIKRLADNLGRSLPTVDSLSSFAEVFFKPVLSKPLILIIDEFDALQPPIAQNLIEVFRNIHMRRSQCKDKSIYEKDVLLYGLALGGAQTLLVLDNQVESPFSVQCSIHIPKHYLESQSAGTQAAGFGTL